MNQKKVYQQKREDFKDQKVKSRAVVDKFEDDHAHASKDYHDKVDVDEIESLETPPKGFDLVVEAIITGKNGEEPVIYCIHIWS